MYHIGIDLGTTNISCSICHKNDQSVNTEILSIKQLVLKDNSLEIGHKSYLPSIVCFENDDILTGVYLMENLDEISTKENSIIATSVKNHIGDEYWRCTINKYKSYNVIETTAILLKTVWDSLKERINTEKINEIIITIPAKFTSKMRHNTLLSAKIAGIPLQLVKLLDEPIAAIFSNWSFDLGFISSLKSDSNKVMVYDLGGGTIDVSILNIDKIEKEVEIISSSRYNNFGGIDWDLEISAFILSRIQASPDYNNYFEDHDQVRLRKKMLKLMEIARKIKELIDNFLVEHKKCFDENIPLRDDFNNLINSNKLNFEIDIDLKPLEELTPKQLSINFNDLGYSFLWLFDISQESKTGYFTPIDQALENSKPSIDITEIDKIFLTGGGSNSKIVVNQINVKTSGRISHLDSMYSISKGASIFSFLFHEKNNTSHWHLIEKTTEKIYLGISGRSFIEIFNSGLNIPSNWVVTELEEERILLRQLDNNSNQRKRGIRVSLYQGINAKDSMMRPFADVRLPLFKKLDIYNDIHLISVRGQIDENSIYKFEFYFKDINGITETSTIQFDIDNSIKKKKLMNISKLNLNNISN